MDNLNILLVCGSGASSGFMAANMRKSAKAQGLKMEINARSESEVEFYAAEADCIMLGPHLAYLEAELKDRVKGTSAKVMVMSKTYYSTLDGAAAIEDLMKHLG